MEPVARELSSVAAKAEGIIRLIGCGNQTLLDYLEHDQSDFPGELLETPLLLGAHAAAAPRVVYPLWACWLQPDTALHPGLLPLAEWKRSLNDAGQTLPLLLLARATGAFDQPPVWDLRLSSLLDERNPFGNPDGRLLLMAAGNPPNASPATHLAAALSAYFASLEHHTAKPFPPGCLVLRSGRHRVLLEAVPHLRVVPLRSSSAKRSGFSGPDRSPFALPAGVKIQCSLHGPMIWGASCGNRTTDSPVIRFLTLAGRPAKSMTIQFGVFKGHDPTESGQLQPGHPSSSGGPQRHADRPAGGTPPGILQRLLDTIERDGSLRQAGTTPYQLVCRISLPSPLPLSAAVTPLSGTAPELPGSGGPRRPAWAPPAAGFVSFYEHLSRPRDLAVLRPAVPDKFSSRAAGRSSGFVSSDEPQLYAAGALAAQPQRTPLSSERQITSLDETRRIARHIHRCSRHAPWSNLNPLQVDLSWTRSRRLLWILMPGVARVTGVSWPPQVPWREPWNEGHQVSCSLSATLPAGSLQAWRTVGASHDASLAWLRSVSAAIQAALRAFLPLVAYQTEADAADCNWTRAELVFRHSRVQSAGLSRHLDDPRDDAILRRVAASAFPGLRRLAASWKEMAHQAGAFWPAETSDAFAQRLVDAAIVRPHPLRKLLLEELEICEVFWQLVNPERQMRFQAKSLETKINRISGDMVRAANRLHAGGGGHTLIPLLMLAASGAVARAQGLEGTRYQIQLKPLDPKGKPNRPAVVLSTR